MTNYLRIYHKNLGGKKEVKATASQRKELRNTNVETKELEKIKEPHWYQ